MNGDNPDRSWDQQLKDAGARVEEEVREFIRYFNDDVVPDIRKNGSEALRAAAQELNRLAQRMDERAGPTPPREGPTPPKDALKP
ncbi:MAG TPA: hypothetical protein VGB69_11625 [Edaphobacter sp.]